MKKILIIFAVLTGASFLLLLLLPFFFRGNIAALAEEQAARYLDTRLDIGKMKLNMFKSFPYLQVKIEDIILYGRGEFAEDTVVSLPSLTASVNILSLIKGREIIIRQIDLKNTRVYAVVSAKGDNNWDILSGKDRTSGEREKKLNSSPSQKQKARLILKDLNIENLFFRYLNIPSSTEILLPEADFRMSGDLSTKQTTLQLWLRLRDAFYRQKKTVWISQWNLEWEAMLDARLQEYFFSIRENQLKINDLALHPKGTAIFGEGKAKLDLNLSLSDAPLENLLALIPRKYKNYTEQLHTDGQFNLNARCTGEYSAHHLPAFNLKFRVEEGSLHYTGSPESIRQIALSLNVGNPGGMADSTTINLEQLSFDLAGQPFHIALQISDLQDPLLKGNVKGTLDFALLSKAFPFLQFTLGGIVTTDLHFSGRYLQLERKNDNDFLAQGELRLKDMFYAGSVFPAGLRIPEGWLRITPTRLTLERLQMQTDSSNLFLKGYISDYLPYFLKGETLKGNFTLLSDRLQLTRLQQTVSGTRDTLPSEKKTDNSTPLLIPNNLQLQLQTDLKNVTAGNLNLQRVKGQIHLSHSVATLKDLQMELLGGSIAVNGKYNTEKYKFPHFNLHIRASELDLREASEAFPLIRNTLPVAMNCEGKISSAFQLSADLSMDKKIRTNTLNGEGYISSKGLLIRESPALKKLADFLQNEELNRLPIGALKINFKIENGNITVPPFTALLAGNPATIYGRQTASGKLDYMLSLNVDRKFFSKDITNLLQAIPGSGNIQNLDIDARITGTLNRPEVKADLSKAFEKVRKSAEKDLKRKALKGLEKLFK